MSTGLECEFLTIQAPEKPAGEWFYILQNWDCPVGAWDWHEYATAYGPFDSEDSANAHLRQNHANPGGSMVDDVSRDPDALGDVLTGLIAAARQRPTKPRAALYGAR